MSLLAITIIVVVVYFLGMALFYWGMLLARGIPRDFEYGWHSNADRSFLVAFWPIVIPFMIIIGIGDLLQYLYRRLYS